MPQKDRTRVVVSISKSGTQCRVRWGNVVAPQLFHNSFLDPVPECTRGTDVETSFAADLIPHIDLRSTLRRRVSLAQNEGAAACAGGDRSGGLFSGPIGYRWQTNQLVFGLEAQGDWADLSSTRVSLLNPAFSTRAGIDAIGLFTGQIGWAWDAALFYLKGGAAVTRSNLSIFTTAGGVEVLSADASRWCGTVGFGFEYGFAPNWSAGIEYNYLFMGDTNRSRRESDEFGVALERDSSRRR